jgi:hypothetical protein
VNLWTTGEGQLPFRVTSAIRVQEKEMTSQATAAHGVMESGGSYNRHAKIPAGGGVLALPFLEQAVKNVTLESGDQPIVIADYGSSQGKNSLAPMRAAIKGLRARVGPARPILVAHIDQAANDFNTLFDVLRSDPERYSGNDPNVFPSAIGRSFYENVFPQGHVHLGWSSYAAVWLSRIPMRIPGHFMVLGSTGDVRKAFARQAREDWEFFLSLRAGELRPGGRLVVVLPALSDNGVSGFEALFGLANEALAEMVAQGGLSAADREAMVLGAYPRRRSELLAPFQSDGQFNGLIAEHCELSELPDAAWVDYERDKNTDALATRHAQFFRAIFVPSLASAIADEEKRSVFPDCFEEKLKRRLANRPLALHSFVQTMVIAKQDGPLNPSVQK